QIIAFQHFRGSECLFAVERTPSGDAEFAFMPIKDAERTVQFLCDFHDASLRVTPSLAPVEKLVEGSGHNFTGLAVENQSAGYTLEPIPSSFVLRCGCVVEQNQIVHVLCRNVSEALPIAESRANQLFQLVHGSDVH